MVGNGRWCSSTRRLHRSIVGIQRGLEREEGGDAAGGGAGIKCEFANAGDADTMRAIPTLG